jgi:hypothetical protein
MTEHKSTLLTRLPVLLLSSLVIGSSYLYLAFVFVLQHIPVHTLLLIVLLCVCTAVAHQLLKNIIIPSLALFSPLTRLVIVGVCAALGLITIFSNPLSIPLLGASVFGTISAVIGGGSFILVLFILLGLRYPLNPAKIAVISFFAVYLVVGLAAYDDYGLSYDEQIQRQHGLISLKYILRTLNINQDYPQLIPLPELPTYRYRLYGVGFHLPLVTVELLNQIDNSRMTWTDFQSWNIVDPGLLDEVESSRTLWLFRHYFTFLFFYAGVVAFYHLALEKFDNRYIALVGAIFLVLTPRIFAESFYNVKDTTFLSAFTIALYAGYRFWRNPSVANAMLFSLTTGYASSIRILAFGLIPVVFLPIMLDLLKAPRSKWFATFSRLMLTGIVCLSFFLLLTPASWADPIWFLLRSVRRFSDFSWEGVILYMGEFITGKSVPWHYLPVWMSMTVPIHLLFLFVVGSIVVLGHILRTRIQILWSAQREELLFLAVLIGPLALAILRGSTLYNGWRHFTFIYGVFLLICLVGLNALIKGIQQSNIELRRTLLITCMLGITASSLQVLHWMVANHPFQNVYFNNVIAGLFGGREAFERDYWRLSVRQALEYILVHDDRQVISIALPDTYDAARTLMILTPEQRRRIDIVPVTNQLEVEANDVDYFISPLDIYTTFTFDVHYRLVVDGLTIMEIYSVP